MNAPVAPALIAARWFDGLSSQPRAVLIGLQPAPEGPRLHLHPLQAGVPARQFAHHEVQWPEAWNDKRPQPHLVVDLGPAGSLEIDDGPAWQAAVLAAGKRPGLAQRMQQRWGVLLAMLIVAVGALALFYRYGTPWLATQLARHVPLGWEQALSDKVLQQMEGAPLRPSRLPPERQAALQARFAELTAQAPAPLARYAGYAPQYLLLFRSGMPANAFALPGGTVVVTDALVRKADTLPQADTALVGVLAHEMGHVVHRHTTRMVVEQAVLNVGLGLALGDLSGVLSTGAAAATGLAYRRNHEREADCYAIALMAHAKLPTAPMGDLLLALSHTPIGKDKDEKEDSEAPGEKAATASSPSAGASTSAEPPAPARERSGLWEWLETHPDTAERAKALRQGQGQASGCHGTP
jgi:Zn-dependent protease with chaperone function